MLTIAQLQIILLYPVRDAAARKNFLIATALMFANFIVPILPMLALMGYVARVMRQVIDEKRDPTMPEWDDWNAFLTDGLRIWGFRLVISLPIILMMFGGMGLFFISIILGASTSSSESPSPLFLAGMMLFFMTMMFFVIIAIPLGVISMVGSTHVIARRSFSAGFAFKEWWPIFRKNLGAFIIYYLVAMAVSYILVFVIQILFITIIFICLTPFIFPAVIAYMLLIQDVLFAKAYAEGRGMLTPAEVIAVPEN